MRALRPDLIKGYDSNYVNNPGIKTWDNNLLFLIYPAGQSGFIVYDGTNVQCDATGAETRISILSQARSVQFEVLSAGPTKVTVNGAALPQATSAAAYDASASGWRSDAERGKLLVKFPHAGGSATIEF
jgi:hypothetical protein